MKTPSRAALVVAAAVLGASQLIAAEKETPAPAPSAPLAKKPLSKVSCEEFTGLDETIKPKVVAWGAAYARGYKKPGMVFIDVDEAEKVTPFVIDECQKTPKASLWDKIKAGVSKYL